MRMLALDISKWDGVVDFPKLKEAGFEAVFIRASCGYVKDPKLDDYMMGAKSVGLWRFSYHYLMPALNYITQADNYANWVNPYQIEGAHHADVEEDGGLIPTSKALQMAHGFCQETDIGTKKVTDIYTAPYIWKRLGGATATWVNNELRKLWNAQYPIDLNPDVKQLLPRYIQDTLNGLHNPSLIPPWTRSYWWQLTAKMTVVGVEAKDVDGDASISIREEVIQEYNLQPPALPPSPQTLEELIDRYIKLETWAIAHGYKI